MEHNAQRICRPCAWPRGAAFCLGLKIYISPFRAAPGGQIFPHKACICAMLNGVAPISFQLVINLFG